MAQWLLWIILPHAQGRTISHEAIYTWIYARRRHDRARRLCLPSRRAQKTPCRRALPIVGMRLIDERPDIADG